MRTLNATGEQLNEMQMMIERRRRLSVDNFGGERSE